MANNSRLIYAFVAGPVLVGAAYGISSLLTADGPASETADAGLSLAYGLLIWLGAPVAFVASLPLLAGIVKVFTKS